MSRPRKKPDSNASPRGAEAAEIGRELQAAFFRRMGTAQQFRGLWDQLADVDFFAKDAEGRFVAADAGTLWRVGVKREEELLGMTDWDIHPPQIARAIREDDAHVMRTRQPLIDRVEALFTRTRAKNWYLTTKLPVIDVAGDCIGVMGFVRPYRGGSGGERDDSQVQRVVAHVHQCYRERLAIADLAKLANLSERQLNRRFQQIFRMSAQEFIIRTRIQAASDALLETNKPVAEIAREYGFYDQSAFTRQFRQHTGQTPLEFRRTRSRVP